jgi:hypothetical protein
MKDAAPLWTQMASKYDLIEPDFNRLVSAWHTDAEPPHSLIRPL